MRGKSQGIDDFALNTLATMKSNDWKNVSDTEAPRFLVSHGWQIGPRAPVVGLTLKLLRTMGSWRRKGTFVVSRVMNGLEDRVSRGNNDANGTRNRDRAKVQRGKSPSRLKFVVRLMLSCHDKHSPSNCMTSDPHIAQDTLAESEQNEYPRGRSQEGNTHLNKALNPLFDIHRIWMESRDKLPCDLVDEVVMGHVLPILHDPNDTCLQTPVSPFLIKFWAVPYL